MVWALLRSDKEKEIQKRKCELDILHWIRYFCFLDEPRDLENKDKPFFPYEFQEEEFLYLVALIQECGAEAQGKKANVLYEKSRDMGISWVVTHVFLWFFLFHRASFIIGSRKEEECDKGGVMKTPFAKMKYQLSKHKEVFPFLLPPGWDPRIHTGIMKLINPLGGDIVGESANPNFGRGARALAAMYDEFPTWQHDAEAWQATQGTIKCRIAIGTPGPTGQEKYARLRFQQDGLVNVRTLHWSRHPDKAADLEIIEGKPTSSWYRQEAEICNEEELAKEVDISYAPTIRGRVFENYGFAHQCSGLRPVEGKQIIVSWDPGLEFHVLWGQVDTYERVLFLKELHLKGAHLDDVAREVLTICAKEFNGYDFYHVGDPYGSYRQVSAQKEPDYVQLKTDYDIEIHSQFLANIPTKDRVKTRILLLQKKMRDLVGSTGTAGLLLDPQTCPYLHRAFSGEYKRMTDRNGLVLDQIDEQHPSEDAVDCAGQLALAKIPWGAATFSRDRIKVRDSKTRWGRPNGSGGTGRMGRYA